MAKGVRVDIETRSKILSDLKKGERDENVASRYGLAKETVWKIARQFSRIKIESSPALGISNSSLDSGTTASNAADFIELGVYKAPHQNLVRLNFLARD